MPKSDGCQVHKGTRSPTWGAFVFYGLSLYGLSQSLLVVIAHPCICLLRTLSPSIPLAALAPLRALSRLAARRLHTSSSMVVTPTRPPVEPSGPPLSPLALASAAHANSSDSYFSAQAGSRPLPRHRRTSGSSFSKLSEFSLDPPLLDKTDQYAASPDQIDENGVTGVRHVALSVDAR